LEHLSLSDADEQDDEWLLGRAANEQFSSLDECLNISFLRRNFAARTSNLVKRQKTDHVAPISFGRLQTTLGQAKTEGIRILFDTGSSKSHVKRQCIKKLRLKRDSSATWMTAAGPINTTEKCKLNST
jgi:hypothetical protein